MPLIILVGQGYLFALILLYRFYRARKTSDLLLAVFLIITGLRCTAYMIGFMSWYDTFPNTKINYFLPDFSLILGPLMFFYVKSLTVQTFAFKKEIFGTLFLGYYMLRYKQLFTSMMLNNQILMKYKMGCSILQSILGSVLICWF